MMDFHLWLSQVYIDFYWSVGSPGERESADLLGLVDKRRYLFWGALPFQDFQLALREAAIKANPNFPKEGAYTVNGRSADWHCAWVYATSGRDKVHAAA